MESVAELLKWVLENLNYWVVTIFMAIESSFIPFPSEAVVPPAAWKAMADDSMNIFLVVLFATIGADIGALVNYYLARWLGRPIIYKFANSRLGHMCLIDEEKPIKDQAIWNGLYFYMQANDWHFLDFLESFSGSINKRDIQLCILIRLGYSPSDLAILLLISKQNVTKIRAKLAGILFNEDGKSSKNFDNLIRNFQGKP